MSHRQTFWDQNCPIGSHLKFFCRGTPKNAKKCFFLHSGNLLEFLVLVPKSGVPPCQSSSHEDSKNVVIFGCGSLQRRVRKAVKIPNHGKSPLRGRGGCTPLSVNFFPLGFWEPTVRSGVPLFSVNLLAQKQC